MCSDGIAQAERMRAVGDVSTGLREYIQVYNDKTHTGTSSLDTGARIGTSNAIKSTRYQREAQKPAHERTGSALCSRRLRAHGLVRDWREKESIETLQQIICVAVDLGSCEILHVTASSLYPRHLATNTHRQDKRHEPARSTSSGPPPPPRSNSPSTRSSSTLLILLSTPPK
jgi:hypothetical protein